MKDFLKYTLASIVGLLAFSIIVTIISIVSLVGIAASSSTTTTVNENSLFKLDLKGEVTERMIDNPFASFMSEEQTALGLNDILSSIQKAAENEYIKGIYLEAGGIMASPASTEEIRNALMRFKQTGKFIVAYGDNYTESDYYICSVADKVILNPQGMVDWHGTASQTIYFKDLLAQLGVEMEVFKVGTYKSAVEPYTSMEMSDENREQITAYITSIWDNMVEGVSLSRGISAKLLNEYADRYIAFEGAEASLTAGLVDTLLYMDGTKAYLKEKMEIKEDDRLSVLSLEEVKNIQKNVPLDKSGNIIAVYYAYGGIDDTSSPEEGIDSEKVIKDLRLLREDETIQAVVLRVNSPGGSAYGSEQIWNEVLKMKAEKPVVVSMGDYAASGGYFISLSADYIVAEPATFTGSIGVVGGKIVLQKLWDKLDINWGEISFGDNAGILSYNHPFNKKEQEVFNASLDRIYKDFTTKVMSARKFDEAKIDKIARGRVWLGKDAFDLGLVDALGGLDVAIIKAKELAKINQDDKFSLMYYPRRQSFQEKLVKFIENGGGIPAVKMLEKNNINIKDIKMLQYLRYDTVMLPFKVSM